MGDLIAGIVTSLLSGTYHHLQGVVCMRGGEERWEKLQMNKQQVGYEGRGVRTWEGTPERGGLEKGLWGGEESSAQ